MYKLFFALTVLFLLLFSATSVYSQETATLTVRSRYGSPDPPVGTRTYALNTEITASVATPVAGTPGIRYVCTGYRARGSPDTLPPTGEGNSVTFTITMNTTLTWTWKTQYLLTVTVIPEGSGTIDVQPPSTDGYYDAKSTITLTAIDGEGYDFSFWSGGLRGTANPQNLLLRGPRTVTANFILEKRYFTVNSAYGEPNPAVGTYEYDYGTTVNTNCGPTPYAGGTGIRYICTGHLGTGNLTDGLETSVSFVITVDSSVTWLWQTQYYLTIDSTYGAPVGAGWYNSGTTANWSVTSPWPGGTGIQYVADSASGSILMDSAKTVTVTWTTQYQLTTTASPPEGGTITRNPNATWYNPGASVELTAAANEGYTFTNWSGDLIGTTNPQSLTMDAPKSVTANFEGNPTLTVNNPGGYDTPVPAVGTYSYAPGTSVTCSMTTPVWPDSFTEGFESGLTGWTVSAGWVQSSTSPHSGSYCAQDYNTTSSATHSISRTFTIGAGGGSVTFWWHTQCSSGTSDRSRLMFLIDDVEQARIYGTNSWTSATYSLTEGTHTVKWNNYHYSSVGSTYNIYGWLDDITVLNILSTKRYVCIGYTGTGSCPSGSGTTVTVTITTASSITWNWTTQFKLTTSVNPAGWGSVSASPSQEWYDSGASVQLTASPSISFSNWSGGLTGSDNPATITMDAAKNITANFSAVPCTLTVSSAHGSSRPPAGTQTYNYGQSLTCSAASPEFELVSGTFTDGFESGTSQYRVSGGSRIGGGTSGHHTGYYAAVLSAVADNCYSYMERTFTILEGGGEITFWWKVSSESNGDYLRFYIDGVEAGVCPDFSQKSDEVVLP